MYVCIKETFTNPQNHKKQIMTAKQWLINWINIE